MNARHAAALAVVVLAVFWLALTGPAFARISIAPSAPQQRVAQAIPKFTVDQQGKLVAPYGKPTAALMVSEQGKVDIPQVPIGFEGCWEGTVSVPDSWQLLEGPSLGGWISRTFRLCFRRTGNGPFTVTIDTRFASERISNYQEQTKVVSTDGRNQALLHSAASMDELGRSLGFFPGRAATITASSDLRCVLVDEDKTMNVETSEVDRCSALPSAGCFGQPWVKATWHAQFHRTTNTSPK